MANMTKDNYKDFIDRFKMLIGERHDLISTTLGNIFRVIYHLNSISLYISLFSVNPLFVFLQDLMDPIAGYQY